MTKAMQNAERLAKESLNADGYDHSQRVAGLVVEFGEQAVVVALLHDVVEDTGVSLDTGVTLDDIRAEFGDAVATSVEGVTRHALGKETYLDFIYRAKTDAIAKVVKTADVIDHLNNLSTLKPSLLTRYIKALAALRR
jgi:guanosine-3',5'-bis(diphosphate) 3'-pyrophosphohydrolase